MTLFNVADWRSMASQPAIGVAATFLAYLFAVQLHRLAGARSILNPTLVSIVIIALALKVCGLDYKIYAQSAAFVTFMLGPAVVLLAVPLFRRRQLIWESGRVIGGALAIGMPAGALSAVGFAWLFGADRQTLLSLAPKSATAGIAIGISEKIGGLPALIAVLVIMTGIVGAVCGPFLIGRIGVRDPRAVGLAIGISSHGIGTARALQIGEVAGAFSGLGMGLNGVLTAIALPLICNLF